MTDFFVHHMVMMMMMMIMMTTFVQSKVYKSQRILQKFTEIKKSHM